MATLIVEDGTGKVDSNSYVDVAYADDYFARHPFYSDSWAALTPTRKGDLLIFASAQLDRMFEWSGYTLTETQAMRWPRQRVYTRDGYLMSMNVIPVGLKEAVCEYAFHLSKGDPEAPTDTTTNGITELKIDVIELKFDSSVKAPAVPTVVARLLRGLYDRGYGSRVAKVLVG